MDRSHADSQGARAEAAQRAIPVRSIQDDQNDLAKRRLLLKIAHELARLEARDKRNGAKTPARIVRTTNGADYHCGCHERLYFGMNQYRAERPARGGRCVICMRELSSS